MPVDLTRYSAKELNTLITQAAKRKTLISKRKSILVVRRKLEKLAKDEGYTLNEIFGNPSAAKAAKPARGKKAAAKKTGAKVAPKYRNPAKASETWSGRGRQPVWLAKQIESGKKLEDFLIKE